MTRLIYFILTYKSYSLLDGKIYSQNIRIIICNHEYSLHYLYNILILIKFNVNPVSRSFRDLQELTITNKRGKFNKSLYKLKFCLPLVSITSGYNIIVFCLLLATCPQQRDSFHLRERFIITSRKNNKAVPILLIFVC